MGNKITVSGTITQLWTGPHADEWARDRQRMMRLLFASLAVSRALKRGQNSMMAKARRILDEHSNARKAKRRVELARRRNRAITIVLTRESRFETLPGTPSFAQVLNGVWPFEV